MEFQEHTFLLLHSFAGDVNLAAFQQTLSSHLHLDKSLLRALNLILMFCQTSQNLE